jgi:filamentous hemagglutinin family protein
MNTIQNSQQMFPDLFKPAVPATKPRRARRKRMFGTLRKPGNALIFMVSFMTYLLGIFPALLYALPSDPTVQAGSVTFDESSPNALTVQQSTDKAIIDWRSFSIDSPERVDFQLPSAAGITLNRVTGNEPSAILGKLTSNGNLFLINPNGVLFGAGSQIDVHGLVATTSDIRNEDFLLGNYNFNIPSTRNGTVVNRGTITASQGGLVALVAPGVLNEGIINARLGQVSLASGNTFTLDLYGDQLVNFGLGSQVVEQVTGLDGEALTSLVSNRGKIFADGGTVLLDVNAASGVVDQVINMSGIIQARTAENVNGKIILRGGDQGQVQVAGTLDATGLGTGETGGTIHVFGDDIALIDHALLNASGDAGGGEILVGGDYQGLGHYPTASKVYAGRDVSIFNDAISTGHGGRSIFWANRRMRFFGSVYARGGREWGDGGFVEVSGKEELYFDGWADTTATNGLTGTLLLDPEDIIIADGSGPSSASGATTFTIFEDTLEALSGNTNVELLANNSITLNDLADDLLNLNISGSVTLTAVNGGITFADTGDKIKSTRNINLTAGGDLNLGSIESTDASITLQGNDLILGGTLSSANGTTTLLSTGGGAIGMGTGAGTFSISGTELQNITANNLVVGDGTNGDITVKGITSANSNNITGTTTLNATQSGSSVTFENPASTFNALTVTAGNGITVSGNLTTKGAAVFKSDTDGNGSGTFTVASGKTLATGNNSLSVTGGDIALSGNLNSGTGTTTLLASNGGTIGLGAGAGAFSLSGTELQNITAGNLIVGNSATGNIIVDGVTATNSNNIAGTTTLNATKSGSSVTFSGTQSTFNALTANGGNGVAVNTAVSTDAGNLELSGGTGSITGTGTTNLTSSQGITLSSDFSSMGDANLNAGTGITLANGVNVSSGGTLSLTSTTGTTAQGAVTVSSANGLTLNDDFTSNGTATFDADSNDDGTGTFTVASGKTVATGNNSLSVTGGDIALSGNLNSGTGTTTLLASNGGTIGLGDGAGAFSLSGSELQNITAGNLIVGGSSNGNITVDGVTATNSNNIAGTTTLNATKSGSSVTFSGTQSTFNALKVNAQNGVAVNQAVTTDAGNLSLSGGRGSITGTGTTNLTSSQGITLNNDFSSTGDANINAGTGITLASGINVASGGTLSLTSTTGTTAQGAVTVNSANGLTLNDDFTSNGTATFDADSNNDGTGTFTVASGKTVATGNNSLSVTGGDIALSGNLNSGTGTTTLLASNGGAIGLGTGAGAFSLSGSELQNITAGNLIVGNSATGNITVDGVTAANSNNIAGTTTLNATKSGSSGTFSGTQSTFNALTVNAEDGITVSENLTTEGVGVFDADSNDDGTGTFTVANGKSVSTGNNSLSVTGGDIALSGNLNSGTGRTTLLASNGGTIGLGAGAGTFSVSDSELDNITAGDLTIGDSTNGTISIDGATVGNSIAGTTTLNATKVGSNVNFNNNASSFGGLAVNSAGTVSDAGGGQLSVTGASSFTGTTAVSLTNTANSFTGGVGLTSGGDATLTTNNALTLATSTIGGNLVVTVAGGNGLIVGGNQTVGGTIALTTGDDITLTGGLFSSSASASAISLTSSGGGIFDGDTTETLDISAPTGGLVVNSVTGFGTTPNPIETKIASIDINNTGAGVINIFETDALDIVNLNHSGTGDVTVSYFGSLTGEGNASTANGTQTFTNRDSGGRILEGLGVTLSDASTARTVNVVNSIEKNYFGGNPPSANDSNSPTEILSGPSSGPFVTNVFDENFELIQVAKKTRKAHKGLRGFAQFWGPKGNKNTEMVKRPSRKSVREEAKLRKKSREKRKRLERKRRSKTKNARLERLGDTAALPKTQRKKKPDSWLSQTLDTFFKN